MSPVADTTASIELCHLYAPERLVSFEGWGTGVPKFKQDQLTQLHDSLAELEKDVTHKFSLSRSSISRLALFDEVLAREHQRAGLNQDRWELFIGVSRASLKQGAQAEIYDESTFVARGKKLQNLILAAAEKLKISMGPTGKLSIPTNIGDIAVQVFGFAGVKDTSHPSCAVLDLAWTEWRTQNFSRTFTALPKGFNKQQTQVAALAALLNMPNRETVTTLLLNPEGQITREWNFGSVELRRG